MHKKIMVVLGTRPEAIKLSPVILALRDNSQFETYILATGQHDVMLNQVLDIFRIKPDKNLGIMTAGQTLTDISTRTMKGMDTVLKEFRPDVVLVQGDTTTAFAAALAAYYEQIPVGHVEAGLRTGNKYNPFPEEMNRRMITAVADYHFAPTSLSARRLEREGIPAERVFVTGNTVIDAMLMSLRKDYVFEDDILNALDYKGKKIIVMTMHRRESFGEPMRNILTAVRRIAEDFRDVEIIFPVHFNPRVREAVDPILGKETPENIHLIDPLGYLAFVHLMEKSFLILTDSGGLQEEAPALGKPVLVLRETTERPEGVEAGTARLVGTDPEMIYKEVRELITDPTAYDRMAKAVSPYGDGKASERIVEILLKIDKGACRK